MAGYSSWRQPHVWDPVSNRSKYNILTGTHTVVQIYVHNSYIKTATSNFHYIFTFVLTDLYNVTRSVTSIGASTIAGCTRGVPPETNYHIKPIKDLRGH